MSVHRTVLGPRHDALPATLRALHDRGGTFAGTAAVEGDDNAFARSIRTISNLPAPTPGCVLAFDLRIDVSARGFVDRGRYGFAIDAVMPLAGVVVPLPGKPRCRLRRR